MIYIASPYSTADAIIRGYRYLAAFAYVAKLMDRGEICFSPIVYGHQFFVAGHAEQDFRFWRPFNDVMLRSASVVHVLMLEGWDNSSGIMHELEVSQSLNLPVHFVEPQ